MVCLLSAAAICCFALFKYFHTKALVVNYSSEVKTWLKDHRQFVSQKMDKVKQFAERQRVNPEQIKFEFYSTLPSAKFQVLQLAADEKKALPIKKAETTLVKKTAFSSDILEREFAAEILQEKIILQLGVYSNFAAADNARKKMALQNMRVHIFKERGGKYPSYRLQKGPFPNMRAAKADQKKLQQLGIKSVVRKVENIPKLGSLASAMIETGFVA